jgi:CHAD domain-containing protein
MNPCVRHLLASDGIRVIRAAAGAVGTLMTAVEREAKFSLPPTFDARRLATSLEPYRAGAPQTRRLHTIYFDSEDLRLARWDISLRYRTGEGWTLKLPSRDGDPYAPSRLECTFAGTDPARPPENALEIVSGTLRGALVRPVAELRTLRITRRIERPAGGTVGELVCDDAHVVRDGRTVRRCRQVEIELAPGAARVELYALARWLRRKTPARPTSLTKVRFALGTADVTRETHLAPLRRRSCRSDVVRCALAPALDVLVRADPHLRVNDDPEWVHAARVAARKLRSSLKVYALRGRWSTDARASLKRLCNLLGAVRDADVLGERVAALGASLPRDEAPAVARIAAPIGTSRDAAYALLHAALRESWYIALLDTLLAAVSDGPPLDEADRLIRPRAFVARTMRRSWKKLNRAVSHTGADASVAALHALRIFAKRSRYVADALAPLVHGNRARVRQRFLKRLARLQDQLGAIHDIAVERDALRAGDGTDRFVTGELVGLDTARGAALRNSWNGAWQDAARRRFRFWR